MSSDWSPAVMSLATLASSGNRNGCLEVIPTLQSDEINTIIDPLNNLTFLHRACQLKEVAIVTSLLQHGADISITNSLGKTCWSVAASEASLSILTALAPYVNPTLSNSLTALIGSKLSETDILPILPILLSRHQSEWVDLHHESVHLSVFLERFEILKFLLHSGFEVCLRKPDGHGLTPLQVAEVRLVWLCTPAEKQQSLRSETASLIRTTSHSGETKSRSSSRDISATSETINSSESECSNSEESSSSSSSSSSSGEEDEEEGSRSHSRDSNSETDYLDDEDREKESAVHRARRQYIRSYENSEQKETFLEIQNTTDVKNCLEILLHLTEIMGFPSALMPPHGFLTYYGVFALIRHFGVFQLLDRLSQDFHESPWRLSLFSDLQKDSPTMQDQNDGALPQRAISKKKSTGEIANVLNSLAGISGANLPSLDDLGHNWSYTDPGFATSGDFDSIEPFIEIVVEAGRIYLMYLRENKISPEPHSGNSVEYNVSLLTSNIPWYDLFSGPCSEKTTRALIWALASMHPKVRGKHLRAWAHIFQDLTQLVLNECEQTLVTEENVHPFVTSSCSELPLDIISGYLSSRSYPSAPMNPPLQRHASHSDLFSSALIPDIKCDPFPGLSHPSVSALVLERLATLGFSLLYEITGQIISYQGEALAGLEDELFDGLLELFLSIVVPRLSSVHRQLCCEERYRMAKKQTSKAKEKKTKNKKSHKRREEVAEKTEVPLSQSIEEPLPDPQLDPNIESHVSYKTSYGTLPMATLLRRGGVLYPHEWSLARKGASGWPKDRVQMSLLRHVTSVLNSEILGLWHSIDQMLSLLMSPVDDGERLAVLFRSWYIWMLVDDATLKPCHTIKLLRPRTKLIHTMLRNRKVTIQQSSEWELIAASLSRHPLDFHRIYGDKNEVNFFQNGPDSFLRFLTCGLHHKKNPPLVTFLLNVQRKSISNLMDSTPDHDNLHSHLYFILRTPWILSNSQRLDYVVLAVEEREEYIQNHSPHPPSGYEIHLNRFTSPLVWGEAILQQLLIEKYRSMNSTSLSILYQGEAGIGHGPIKEFLDICRIFLSPRGITSQSLIDLGEATSLTVESSPDGLGSETKEEIPMTAETEPSNGENGNKPISLSESIFEQLEHPIPMDDTLPTENKKRPKSRKGTQFMDVPLVSIFPLFRPAGSSYPDCIVPIELEVIAEKILNHKNISHLINPSMEQPTSSTTKPKKNRKGSRKNDSLLPETQTKSSPRDSDVGKSGTASDALLLAKRIFECIGVMLGFCLIHSCPIGTSFPPFVWIKLLAHSKSDLSFSSEENEVTWESYCGQDERLVQSCQQILQLSSDELAAMELPFVGSKYSWDVKTQQLTLDEVELLPNGSGTFVNDQNKMKYINLLTRSRAMTSGMSDSILAIRNGLKRIITQDFLNVLNPIHISEYLHGDKLINIILLQQHVKYSYDFSPTHRVIKLFWHFVKNDLTEEERRKLLLFWTGTSIPSKGGYGIDEGDNDEMIIARKHSSSRQGHGWLPEARTCEKKLYLPEYRTYDEMKKAIKTAIHLGCIGFDRV